MEVFVTVFLVWWVTHTASRLTRAVPGPGTLLGTPSLPPPLRAGVVDATWASSSRTELVGEQSLVREVHRYFTMAQFHSELIHFANRQAWYSCHYAVLTGFSVGPCWLFSDWLSLVSTRRVPTSNCCHSQPGRHCLLSPHVTSGWPTRQRPEQDRVSKYLQTVVLLSEHKLREGITSVTSAKVWTSQEMKWDPIFGGLFRAFYNLSTVEKPTNVHMSRYNKKNLD